MCNNEVRTNGCGCECENLSACGCDDNGRSAVSELSNSCTCRRKKTACQGIEMIHEGLKDIERGLAVVERRLSEPQILPPVCPRGREG